MTIEDIALQMTPGIGIKGAVHLLELFGEINKGGQTILMVTHSVKAASHAGRVLFLRDGRVYHQLNRGSVDYRQKKFFSALARLLKERDEAEGRCRLRKPAQN